VNCTAPKNSPTKPKKAIMKHFNNRGIVTLLCAVLIAVMDVVVIVVHAQDPLCQAGIPEQFMIFGVCCSASCGSCGGAGCGDRPGGAES
jgi:hypothetical protein